MDSSDRSSSPAYRSSLSIYRSIGDCTCPDGVGVNFGLATVSSEAGLIRGCDLKDRKDIGWRSAIVLCFSVIGVCAIVQRVVEGGIDAEIKVRTCT